MVRQSVLVLAMALIAIPAGNVQANLTNGLIAHFPFNGNANDETGNGHDGTVYGATLTTDRFGNSNSAYNFDNC